MEKHDKYFLPFTLKKDILQPHCWSSPMSNGYTNSLGGFSMNRIDSSLTCIKDGSKTKANMGCRAQLRMRDCGHLTTWASVYSYIKWVIILFSILNLEANTTPFNLFPPSPEEITSQNLVHNMHFCTHAFFYTITYLYTIHNFDLHVQD